jgi:predicted dehydrogenase
MAKKIKWGIVGTGGIAHKFAQALAILPDAELTAVASRKKETAQKFASEFNIPGTHVGVDSLANDKNVDAVYIATPHPNHKFETITCLNGGKAVLCEKPLAMNSGEVAQMIQAAKQNKTFHGSDVDIFFTRRTKNSADNYQWRYRRSSARLCKFLC